jgi:hypothetical protein
MGLEKVKLEIAQVDRSSGARSTAGLVTHLGGRIK